MAQGKVELDEIDIENLGMKFGPLQKVVLSKDKTEAYLFYSSMINAYACWKLLRVMRLRVAGR